MQKHKKHANLPRAAGGQFHRLEWGFIGAPCGTIQNLCAAVAECLNDKWQLAYVDAEHGAGEEMESPYHSVFTDKISFHRFDSKSALLDNVRFLFNNHDAVLVNGNHFKTARQVVIINEKKKDSLSRKLERLGQVELIVLDEGVEAVFDFVDPLTPKLGEPSGSTFEESNERFDFHRTKGGVPIVKIGEVEKIASYLSHMIEVQIPEVKGLLFAGGKSTRMGKDKGDIVYHQSTQREHLANLMSKFCSEVYLSSRGGQNISSDYEVIPDVYLGLGPFGGLVSAFQKFPNQAIFTLPIDVPFVDEALLQQLFDNRNSSKVATCFHNPETEFPEPLITIWEPRAYPILLNFLSRGYSCPRKVLINSDIEELTLGQPEKLFNANTPEQRDFAKAKLK